MNLSECLALEFCGAPSINRLPAIRGKTKCC